MTLDAMDWVWNHSQSRGNTRIALLFVADQVRSSACEVRLSYPDFLGALNTKSRGTVKDAIDTAIESGELEIKEPASGRRPPLYRLPLAVGFERPTFRSGPVSGPQNPEGPSACSPISGPQTGASGPISGPQTVQDRSGSGPISGPQDGRSGPETGLPYPSLPASRQEAGSEEPADNSYGIPDAARPLVDSMTASGIYVRWPFEGNQWFPVLALIKKCGVPALVEFARRVSDRTSVESAKYFLKGWSELPPKPAEGTPVHLPRPHLRAVGTPEDRGIF